MSYPGSVGFYPVTNPLIRSVAERTRTPLIDLAAVFAPFCPRHECPELLFDDHHPRPAGYRLVAETLLGRLWGELAR
jgi:lysophospholipase L1-like esterase